MTTIFTSILTLTPLRSFRLVYCQIEILRRCFPTSIRRALDELPETLDRIYKQTLRMIDKQKWDYASRLFQCLVVSKRPLRVEELAELFAIQPNVETIPTFDACLRPEDPEEFILSACSVLVAVINIDGQKIVQFPHLSVREYLISHRIAISEHVSRFHVSLRPAHTLFARACLSVLLQLDDRVDKDSTRSFALALYAAQYWVDHAQFEDVSSDIQHGMECLFDRNRPHFAAWLRLCNIDDSPGIFTMANVHHAQPSAVPLYYAALCGFRDIAKHLVDTHPQDVNARGGACITPLHAAADKGHRSVAKLLLKHGADIESRDSRSRTPLHVSSSRRRAKVVSLLIDRGADANSETDDGKTPLHLASQERRDDVVQLLLEYDADANHPDSGGLTPLRFASRNGLDDIVRILLDHGADANHPDRDGLTPLYLASRGNYDDTIQFLNYRHLPDRDGLTPVYRKSRKRYVHIVRLLLDHDADPNRPDSHGLTPLHLASRMGEDDIVQLLLDHGADASRPDHDGWTPLYLATKWRDVDTVQLLLEHDADANYPDRDGLTPLHLASRQSDDDIVQPLLDHGAHANHPDRNGRTPLYLATQKGYHLIVRLLLDHGADANLPDGDGLTPLHLASLMGHNYIAWLLVDHGADANRPDRDGWTPMHVASRMGHDRIVELLQDHGAEPDADRAVCDDLTPLDLESQDPRWEGCHIVQLLLNCAIDDNAEDVILNSLLFLPS